MKGWQGGYCPVPHHAEPSHNQPQLLPVVTQKWDATDHETAAWCVSLPCCLGRMLIGPGAGWMVGLTGWAVLCRCVTPCVCMPALTTGLPLCRSSRSCAARLGCDARVGSVFAASGLASAPFMRDGSAIRSASRSVGPALVRAGAIDALFVSVRCSDFQGSQRGFRAEAAASSRDRCMCECLLQTSITGHATWSHRALGLFSIPRI